MRHTIVSFQIWDANKKNPKETAISYLASREKLECIFFYTLNDLQKVNTLIEEHKRKPIEKAQIKDGRAGEDGEYFVYKNRFDSYTAVHYSAFSVGAYDVEDRATYIALLKWGAKNNIKINLLKEFIKKDDRVEKVAKRYFPIEYIRNILNKDVLYYNSILILTYRTPHSKGVCCGLGRAEFKIETESELIHKDTPPSGIGSFYCLYNRYRVKKGDTLLVKGYDEQTRIQGDKVEVTRTGSYKIEIKELNGVLYAVKGEIEDDK